MSQTAEKYDRFIAVKKCDENGIVWYSPDNPPFVISGLPGYRKNGTFRRLPRASKNNPVPAEVDRRAAYPAGGCIRFRTDASKIVVRVVISQYELSTYSTDISSIGFDAYTGAGHNKEFCEVTRVWGAPKKYTQPLFSDLGESGMRSFTVYFPRSAAIESLEFGVNEGAVLEKPEPWLNSRPVVMYGASFIEGDGASRPGNMVSNILSRKLDRPVINLGFSGCALGEPAVAEAMAKIKEPALFVLGYHADAGTDGVLATLPRFVEILRQTHKNTPILLLSDLMTLADIPTVPNDPVFSDARLRQEDMFAAEVKKLQAAYSHVHFRSGLDMFGEYCEEALADEVHLNDLGQHLFARNLLPEIQRLI